MSIPTTSPWGEVQYGRELAPGIVMVSTAGHGGVHLSESRFTQMPTTLRVGRQRWFEEDCEAALVLWAFADDIGLTAEHSATAEESVRNWFPAKWEAHTGRVLAPGESLTRDDELFAAETADQFVASSAWGDWHKDVPTGYVGVLAKRKSDDTERHFLVAADRYRLARRYVVDESVDDQWLATAD